MLYLKKGTIHCWPQCCIGFFSNLISNIRDIFILENKKAVALNTCFNELALHLEEVFEINCRWMLIYLKNMLAKRARTSSRDDLNCVS